MAIAVNASGEAFVTGVTYSGDFPTENPYQTDQLISDAFVFMLNNGGDNLLFSTYLGGSDYEGGTCIAVDESGAVYVSGWTESTDFPTEGPYQVDQIGVDGFVTKLTANGSSLLYSTYLGGNEGERVNDIAIDSSGAAYVTGYTSSDDFPTVDPYQTGHGNYQPDAFVTKLAQNGSSLIYSTHLGGESSDVGYRIAVDAAGAAYVTGTTGSTDFPTVIPYQATLSGPTSVFVTKFNDSVNGLIYSTFLGGSGAEHCADIAVDASGAAYVTGWTASTDFPTETPFQMYQGGVDAFVSKLSGSGTALAYSTYLGGDDYDEGTAIAVDAFGAAYVVG